MSLKDGQYKVVAEVYQGEKLPLIVDVENGKVAGFKSEEKLADI